MTYTLVDPSIQWHEAHAMALSALREVKSLPAQVLTESLSVLTRLLGGSSLRPGHAEAALARAFPMNRSHSVRRRSPDVIRRLAQAGLGGVRIYDAIVAAEADEAGARLLTRDRRALSTYTMFGVDYELVA